MSDQLSDAALRRALRDNRSVADALAIAMDRKPMPQPSLARIVEALKGGRGVDGYEAEQLQEHARAHGIYFDARQPEIPFVWLRTPLESMGGSANGGYLAGTSTDRDVLDIFRPWSPMLQSGALIRTGLETNNVAPRTVADVQGYWLNSEATTATESEPLIGSIAMTPKNAGVLVRWTMQLAKQAPNLETFLRQLCARQIITLIDLAAINGTGIGQPLGLLNVAGLATQSGAAFSHASSFTTRTTLANANANDQAIAWIGHPGVRNILATRERAAGDEYIWSTQDEITGRPAFVSTVMPAATLIAGDWSSLCYAFFGSGFSIETTRFNSASDFQTGISAMRLLVSVDTYLQHPSAFVAVTSVS